MRHGRREGPAALRRRADRVGRGRRLRRRGALRHGRHVRAGPARGTRPGPGPCARSPAASRSASRSSCCCAAPTRCCCSTSPTTSSTCRPSGGWRAGCGSPTSPCSTSRTTASCWPRPPTRVVTVEGGSAWTHPGGFATWHEARVARYERLDELRRRWDEEHQKLKDLVLMYKQKAAYNDGMASRYQAAQTRLRKFEEAGPPQLRPKDQDIRMRLQRRPDRQARGDLRAAGAGEPDLPVRPGGLVRRPGRGAGRQRHRQVALPAAAGPGRLRPRRGARAGGRGAAGAGPPRRRGPAGRSGPARPLLADPRPARTWSTRRSSRSSGAATTTGPACPATTR